MKIFCQQQSKRQHQPRGPPGIGFVGPWASQISYYYNRTSPGHISNPVTRWMVLPCGEKRNTLEPFPPPACSSASAMSLHNGRLAEIGEIGALGLVRKRNRRYSNLWSNLIVGPRPGPSALSRPVNLAGRLAERILDSLSASAQATPHLSASAPAAISVALGCI